jgi:transposase
VKIPAMSNFRLTDRLTGYLMPPSVDEWLPPRHLARFVVEVVESLDLTAMNKAYRGSGSASYPPATLLSVLIYGYATGVFSSRKLERATYDSVAFRFIAANDHPDHDTIATFRRRFLKEIEALFVEVLKLAREMGVLKLGTVALDGTKIHANANRHSALSYEHASKIEAQAEVAELLAKAEATDQPMFLTGCRSQRNWRIERPGWRNLLRPVPKSKRVPRNASSGSRLSIRRSWRHGKQRPRPRAGSLVASHPNLPWKARYRGTRST